jgi:SAM-dependent methyltransferase
MRIIAVGDPSRAAPVQAEQSGETDPNAYPPSAARLGTGTRRSSRPTMAAVTAPDVVTAKPPDVDLSPLVAEPAAALLEAPPVAPPSAVAPVAAEVTEELADEDVAPDSVEKKIQAAAEAEELGREDAISVLPEELPAFQAEAKTDPGKPPPPPKRTGGATTSAPASEPAAPPPTPDLAAAKAAQRKNTRQPWWEDLFNEDFMRATARVSDEQIRREVTFIEDSLGVAAGGVVLDLGCGAGHHAVEFASRGYGVVGYDLSLYQLALAADVAQERSQKINFLQGDMREMAFEEMFDGVFCWNTTFGYFEEDKNLAVAQRVFKALRPGGMFLIDVINRDFAAASAPCTVWYEGDSCVCMDDMSVDFISSRLRVKRSIILDDGRTKESLFSLRLYSLHELGKLLHEVGFRVTEASGHPATPGVFFGPNSPRIIMLAQRP